MEEKNSFRNHRPKVWSRQTSDVSLDPTLDKMTTKSTSRVLDRSLLRSLVRSQHSLIRLLRTARFACSHRCAHWFARSLTHSGAHWKEIYVYEMNASISYRFNPLWPLVPPYPPPLHLSFLPLPPLHIPSTSEA